MSKQDRNTIWLVLPSKRNLEAKSFLNIDAKTQSKLKANELMINIDKKIHIM